MNDKVLKPLREFVLQDNLDGSKGLNRSTLTPLIKANTDLEAMECWLAEYANKSTTTYRNYQKDAERILLWAVVERHKPLSSLDAEDLLAFGAFLDNPQPCERWCSGKKQREKRWSSDWRPFVGPLSATAKTKTLANIRSLFNYLVEMNYLARNPFKAVERQITRNNWEQKIRWQVGERILGLEEWYAIQEVLETLPQYTLEECQEKARTRFLIGLLFFTGLRVQELTSHTMGAFQKIYDPREKKDRWWLFIKENGDKLRKIPVNQSLLEVLVDYRHSLNLDDLPKGFESELLVRSLRTGGQITPSRVNKILKTICDKASERFKNEQPEKAMKLSKISTHWFRHLSFSMQDLVNIKKQHIKENAGHESERITEIYVHALDNLRHEEMEKLTWQIPNMEVS